MYVLTSFGLNPPGMGAKLGQKGKNPGEKFLRESRGATTFAALAG
jgi:hypothetical protein